MAVASPASNPEIGAGSPSVFESGWWAANRSAVAFFASLAVLSSGFAAAPWKEMKYDTMDGYGCVAPGDSAAGDYQSRDEVYLCSGPPFTPAVFLSESRPASAD
jgi:hypothetical protein